uniref:EngC GTPase domain-containing protein n=1 Tax=Tetradesmus obliquus TaxID=3088 RepID=A0A383WD87_TETOB|eukprot:jgi/Sobl393_1/12566/SZX75193.1
MSERQALQQLPKAAFGQVISAEANYVRVNISHLDASAAADSSPEATSSSGSSSSSSPSSSQDEDAEQLLHSRHASNSQASSSSSSSSSHVPPPRTQLLCTVRALLKKINQRVLVGDRVRVHGIDWLEGRGVVESVQPRSSELADPAIANVGHVLLLFGLTQPPFEPQQVSRFLVSLGASGLPVTLALNKCDLLPESEVTLRLQQVASWGYHAVAVSCETGQGLNEVAQALQGAVSVVAGPSGAGKSSLINALRMGRHKPEAAGLVGAAVAAAEAAGADEQDCEESDQAADGYTGSSSIEQQQQQHASPSAAADPARSFLAVGDVSKIGRGRHTTRTVTLIELPFGGLMADTPGFNQPTLDRVASADLARLFPEFNAAVEAQGGCRFADCMHLAEPGCAVTAAELERHEHYVKFLAEIKAREEYDVRVMQLAKQRREGALKVVSGRGGVARYEARLDQKHRITSRRRQKQQLWDDSTEEQQE